MSKVSAEEAKQAHERMMERSALAWSKLPAAPAVPGMNSNVMDEILRAREAALVTLLIDIAHDRKLRHAEYGG